MSVKIVVVSHGKFSEGLVNSVQMLAGEQKDLKYYGLFPEQTTDVLREKLQAELEATPEGQEVLFFTDVFHGSPFNVVVDLMRDYDFWHLTGINLPLAVVAMTDRYMDLNADEICRHLMEEAASTLMYVNEKLSSDEDYDDEEDE